MDVIQNNGLMVIFIIYFHIIKAQMGFDDGWIWDF